MAESPWTPRPAWYGIIGETRFGAGSGQPGILVTTRAALGLATVIAPPGGTPALAAAVRADFGLDLPMTPAALRNGACQAVWTAPGQWMLVGDDRAAFRQRIAGLAAFAAMSDQSDSRAVLGLSGPRVRDLLAKGCMIDLHPAAFPVGAAATTSIAHIGAVLWRNPDGPGGAAFELMVSRSMAGSFWSWFAGSAAEFGCEVVAKQA